MDVTINPGLLVQECSFSNPQYVIDELTDVTDDHVNVCVDVVVVLEHTPLLSVKAAEFDLTDHR